MHQMCVHGGILFGDHLRQPHLPNPLKPIAVELPQIMGPTSRPKHKEQA